MEHLARRLRTPEERVGMLPNASLPPPGIDDRVTSSDDELLWLALRHGDEKAFARLLDDYFPAMLRLAMSHVDGRATAEEVIQETWLAAIRGIDRFEGRSSAKTWLFHILRNIARTRGKRDARVRTFSEMQSTRDADSAADPADRIATTGGGSREAMWARASDPEQDLLSGELAAHIERAIARLSPRQREVITLRDVEGWSAAEVCNVMGISQTNQRVILHRARECVRRELIGYLDGYDCGDGDDDDV